MARAGIDHLVAFLLILVIILFSLSQYSNILGAAITYQRNYQVAVRTRSLLDSMLLGPGFPKKWGNSSSSPLVFGLQDPEIRGIVASSFAPLRLIPPENTVTFNGSVFNNVSIGQGASFYLPVDDHVTYSHVAELLGVNGSYGFKLTVAPTLNVSVLEDNEYSGPGVRFKVTVNGPGLPLNGALVNGSLHYAYKVGENPSIDSLSSTNVTDTAGFSTLAFPDVDATETYSVLVQVHLSGLIGIGFCSKSGDDEDLLIPLVVDYEEKTIALAHRGDVGGAPPYGALRANCSLVFLIPTQNFGFQSVSLDDSSFKVKKDDPVFLQLPIDDPGILLIAYAKGSVLRTVLMPWGISSLSSSLAIGDDSSTSQWVATSLRQAVIGHISYQVKLEVWSL